MKQRILAYAVIILSVTYFYSSEADTLLTIDEAVAEVKIIKSDCDAKEKLLPNQELVRKLTPQYEDEYTPSQLADETYFAKSDLEDFLAWENLHFYCLEKVDSVMNRSDVDELFKNAIKNLRKAEILITARLLKREISFGERATLLTSNIQKGIDGYSLALDEQTPITKKKPTVSETEPSFFEKLGDAFINRLSRGTRSQPNSFYFQNNPSSSNTTCRKIGDNRNQLYTFQGGLGCPAGYY